MNEDQIKKICNYLFKDIFERENMFSLEEIKSKFVFDIPLPKKISCILSGKDTWILAKEGEKIASQTSITDQFKKDEWIRNKKPINSINDIFKYWQDINYFTAEKILDSRDIVYSDNIYKSINVYNSSFIFNAKNIIFCYEIVDCNYMLACRNNESCVLGIRMRENANCSSCFDVSWSEKVSKSMYVHGSVDLYECMFCSHLRTKKYCIANMQFEKEEYFRIKKMVVDWILKD